MSMVKNKIKKKVKVLAVRTNTTSILGIISAFGLIKVSLRKHIPLNRNRRFNNGQKYTKGIVINHYVNFIADILDEMDKYQKMKGFRLITDNAPIYVANKVGEIIE
jgi:hypothetical protein